MKHMNQSLKFVFFATFIITAALSLQSCEEEEDVKAPVIQDFAPQSGAAGTTVTITGANFSNTVESNVVKFNDLTATVSSASPTQLIVTVPLGAHTGKITVLNGTRSATSNTDFSVTQSISDFSPTSGGVGSTVIINGFNFDTSPANNVVKFNGVVGNVQTATANQLTVTVPGTASTGKISVTINGVTFTSSADFTVLDATLSQFTPTSGVAGNAVVITGSNFSTVTTENVVKINGVTATVTAATNSQLTIEVPTTASTGKISVTVNGKTVTSTNDFTVPAPTLTTFFPPIAASGRSVVIAGTNFSTTLTNNIVKFNGVDATVTAASATQLTVTVPNAVTNGPISVKVGLQSVTSASNFDVCVGSAELVISDVIIGPGNSSSSYSVQFKVTNSGSVNADLSKMVMQNYASTDAALSNDDAAASGYSFSNAGTLAPGQSFTTPNYMCSINGGTTSSHPYLVITLFDAPDGAVSECNTSNNVVVKRFN